MEISSSTPPPLKRAERHSAGTRMLIPVGRSGYAIASGYLGLLALFIGITGPFAIWLGIVGLKDIKKSRVSSEEVKHGSVRCWFGIVTGLFGMLLIALALTGSLGNLL